MRALRKHALNYLDQLWVLASDRRHTKDVTTQVSELKADWGRVQKRLGKSRDKADNRQPHARLDRCTAASELRHHTPARQMDSALPPPR